MSVYIPAGRKVDLDLLEGKAKWMARVGRWLVLVGSLVANPEVGQG
jgi:hypothetical protein